jgi:hypothetical protein
MPNPASEPGEAPSAGAKPWNPDQRLVGDEKLLHEVMEVFLQEVSKGQLAPESLDVSP